MVCALGLADHLVGLTHECDYPPEIRNKPIVVRNALPLAGLSLREIDAAVSARIRSGASLYEVDEHLLQELAPTLILTQNFCQVCAPSGNAITQNRVYAVDADSYFARPGPRVIDGVNLLAHLIHPELCDWNGPGNSFRPG